jgi:hypothetical protein
MCGIVVLDGGDGEDGLGVYCIFTTSNKIKTYYVLVQVSKYNSMNTLKYI